MKKVFLLLIILSASLASCEKAAPCEAPNTGKLCIENTVNETPDIYINGDYNSDIKSGEEKCVDGITCGTVSIRAVDVVSSKSYLRTGQLASCSTRKVKF